MKIYNHETEGGTKASGDVMLLLTKKEARKLCELIESIADHPKGPLAPEVRRRARALQKDTDNICCY